tara:strand:- start:3969 stop:4910 length:942 start_codon:yes stop_codon:yes gene_type:complete
MNNWGILGLGRMGFTFAEAISEVAESQLISIASKSGKKYKNFENKSYDEVINNENIQSIYISSLNNTHTELINKLIDSKKNILCEKPASMSSNELFEVKQKIFEKNIKFYEAIAYYSHPQTVEILNLIKNDEIGQIRKIESNFGFKAKFNPDSRLYNKKLGGGAIFDLGCYPISFAMLFSKNPKGIKIQNKQLEFAPSEVDDDAKAKLICDETYECEIHVSIKNNLKNICKIHGSKGYINVLNPWLPNKNSQIEVLSNKHFYIKSIKSNISIYANQIKNVTEAFLEKNDNKFSLFDINKSLINMNLMEIWLKN